METKIHGMFPYPYKIVGTKKLTGRKNFDGISNALSDALAALKNFHKFL